jgi:alkyl hydroperoxide reductase subunit AhpF
MSILKIYGGQAMQTALAEIVKPVQVIYLTLDQPAPDTIQALADLSALAPYVSIDVQQEPAAEVDQVIIRAENGRELRFVGPPLGTEIAAMVSVVVVAGRGYSGLSTTTRAALTSLTSPKLVQIFSTPS